MTKKHKRPEKVKNGYLAVDNDGAVDVGADEGAAEGIEIGFEGSGGVADGDAVVGKAGVFGLQSLNNVMKTDNFFDLNFGFFLWNIDNFDFATVVRGAGLQDFDEFDLVGLAAGA